MQSGRIEVRLGARVFLIDTGMLSSHYEGGRPSALSLGPSGITVIYLDSTVPLSGSPGQRPAAQVEDPGHTVGGAIGWHRSPTCALPRPLQGIP